ncbi:MAG: phage integrase N-terminal SAM-like domain-containing protein [Methylococcales bacterium]|nr:phage integrase N-terminal SAM-like domain-containing protein [Methylococcales bacterium]
MDQVRDKSWFKHYSLSTKNTYLSWIKQFILCYGKRHPADMGAAEMESFLTYLAMQRHVKTSCSLRLGSGQAWSLRGENFLACITSDSKFFNVLFQCHRSHS